MALQDLTMMLPSRLGCPLSLKTPNMGNTGTYACLRKRRQRFGVLMGRWVGRNL